MMELRPLQAALVAGRSASRRATANPSTLSYPLIPSFYRYFSSTRPFLSEAEASAPPPTATPSMQEWNQQQVRRQQEEQKQQQQQSEQSQRPAWGSVGATGSMASFLKPNNANPSSPPTLAPAPPPPSNDNLRSPWAAPTSSTLRRRQANRSEGAKTPGIIDDLNLADLGYAPTSEDLKAHLSAMNNEPASEIKYRLRPSVGRTVELGEKIDLARGLGLLQAKVRVNKISQDLTRQRFHERPGLKRKRLRRERWRARFKAGFKASCKRVQELARQGW